MYTKQQLNDLYERIVKSIDISDTLFDTAEMSYSDLSKWIDKETPDYKISIYPQGSFALGTIIKPLSDNDDYDLDLVCEFEQHYGLSARTLKVDVVKPLLMQYKKTKSELEEKRRCWHVEYEDLPNFHMDIIPSINKTQYIDITDHDEENDSYDYIGSNPTGYKNWFFDCMKQRRKAIYEQYMAENRRVIQAQADIAPIKDYKIKTPLQKTIQLLKRHRDISFDGKDGSVKPVSIIITTLAAQLYNNEDNIVDALVSILSNAENYVHSHMRNGEYHIDNPSYTGNDVENFADKWNQHPERAEAFFEWLENAKTVFLASPEMATSLTDIVNVLGTAMGDKTIRNVIKDDVDLAKAFEKKTVDITTELVPYKVQQILSAPHRQKNPWQLPRGSRVVISALATIPNGNKVRYYSDGQALEKGTTLDFRALFGGISQPFTVRWQVVNLGYEAESNNGLRGGFELSNAGTFTRHEGTEYMGSHSIQCFVTKNGQCVAKSDVFIVNIR